MFSIVMPLYNKAPYVSKTITSALAQTYADFELIIVNDGSTDESLETVTQFKDPRIRIFNRENGGVSAARNYGMEMAKGDFIAFLDADDTWEPDYLMEMQRLILLYPECGMYCSAHKIIRENITISGSAIPEGIFEDYFKSRLKDTITWTSATIIKKSVFNHLGGFPVGMNSGQDTYLWIKVGLHYKVAFTPKVLASYHELFSSYKTRVINENHFLENLLDFYTPGHFYLNELIARIVIERAIIAAALHKIRPSWKSIKKVGYTQLYRRQLLMLKLLYLLTHTGNLFFYFLMGCLRWMKKRFKKS